MSSLKPTRCTDISSTCIDPVLIADSLQSLESGTVNVPSHMSDHSGTYTVLEIKCPIPRTYTRDIRIYKDANFDALKRDIATTDWEALFESPNIDINVLYFNKKLTDFVNQHVPQKTIIVRPSDKPWFNSVIRREIRVRDRLRKTYRRTNRQTDLTKYRNQRNKVNNLKKKTERKIL